MLDSSISIITWKHWIVFQTVHVLLISWPMWISNFESTFWLRYFCFALTLLVASSLEWRLVGRTPETLANSRDTQAIYGSAFFGAVVLLLIWLGQFEMIYRDRALHWALGIGGALAMGGVILRVGAIKTLGVHFRSDIHLSGAPIKKGIYRFLKHPGEWGALLTVGGCLLILNAIWTTVLAAVILVPIALWRTHRENAYLSSMAKA